MRLLGRIQGKKKATTFHAFLKREGIHSSLERANEGDEFDIWVEHEDDISNAHHWMSEYQKSSNDPRFTEEIHPIDQDVIKEHSSKTVSPVLKKIEHAFFTTFMICICILLYIWNGQQKDKLEEEKSGAIFYNLTPLFMQLCYDVPSTFPLYVTFFENHPVESVKEFQVLTKENPEFQKIEQIVHWDGLYNIILKWPDTNQNLHAPRFIKLKDGEIWRLFTPVLMHGNLLHILFNMLWLYLLGRQIEERIKFWQYFVMTLLIAIISNTAQYLMSGSLFLGYSGVITGFVGFIWTRQKLAPWEGYPLHRGTILFLIVFIFGMFALQLISFFLIRTKTADFPINVANTAHLSGLITGAIFGRIPLFARGKL